MTRQQVKENRLKFANGLLEPHRIKFKGLLENPLNPNERCCLGHGCNIFNIVGEMVDGRILYGADNHLAVAPNELMDLLGLNTACGHLINSDEKGLAFLNDETDMTTQEIGQYILDKGWIEGGENTPFKPLSDYPLN